MPEKMADRSFESLILRGDVETFKRQDDRFNFAVRVFLDCAFSAREDAVI